MLCPILVVRGADTVVKCVEYWKYLCSTIRYVPCKLKNCGTPIFIHVIVQHFDRNYYRCGETAVCSVCEKSRIFSIWSQCNWSKIPVKSHFSVATFWQLDSSGKSWKYKMQLFPWQWLLKQAEIIEYHIHFQSGALRLILKSGFSI